MPPQAKPNAAAEIVDEDLRLLMIPEPDAARRYVAPDLQIRLTGGQVMRAPDGCAAFNATRYRWVKKRVDHTDAVAGGSHEQTVVDSLGTLHGKWPDGSPFKGNRYVDRFIVRIGLLAQMDLWNNSAEWLIERCGLRCADYRAAQ